MEKKAKILLIDDDPDFVEATRTILESKPYDVLVSYDGNEGLKKAKTEAPDLVLLDIIMPLTDGFSAAEQFKKDPDLSKIPLVMLTSFGQRVGSTNIPLSKGFQLEAEDYVEKPVNPEQLFDIIEKNLKR